MFLARRLQKNVIRFFTSYFILLQLKIIFFQKLTLIEESNT